MNVTWENRNSSEVFMEHDKRMKTFRESHSSIPVTRGYRRDLINKLWPLLVVNIRGEAGGARRHVSTAGWSAYIPISGEVLHRLSQN